MDKILSPELLPSLITHSKIIEEELRNSPGLISASPGKDLIIYQNKYSAMTEKYNKAVKDKELFEKQVKDITLKQEQLKDKYLNLLQMVQSSTELDPIKIVL